MNSAIVFFESSRTCDFGPGSAVLGELSVNQVSRVRWRSRTQTAKIVYVGPMELCEMKIGNVTRDGLLVEDEFDIANVDSADRITLPRKQQSQPTSVERELTKRLTQLEDGQSTMTDISRRLERKVSMDEDNTERLEHMMKELLQRISPRFNQGNLEYKYARSTFVADLRKKHSNPSKFARCLEEEVFKDSTAEMELNVDDR